MSSGNESFGTECDFRHLLYSPTEFAVGVKSEDGLLWKLPFNLVIGP